VVPDLARLRVGIALGSQLRHSADLLPTGTWDGVMRLPRFRLPARLSFTKQPAQPAPPAPLPELRPPVSLWWWALPVSVLIGVAAWGMASWLLTDLAEVPLPARMQARTEAVRTALAAAAGVGAAVTLLLAFRRQRHQELATAHNVHDAAERRVTELYTKAVEQLGSDKAPVRLGGLHALERLAQGNPGLQQTIVDVFCAYLRMPYAPPRDNDRAEKIRAAQRAARTRTAAVAGADPREERQVRLTAQRILTAHLHYPSPASEPGPRRAGRRPVPAPAAFWPDIRLDLNGATLLGLDLSDCRIADAYFADATFTGDAYFPGATFSGNVWFDGATFTRAAQFDGATFTRIAQFHSATFTWGAWFHSATFTGDAWFVGATVTGNAQFVNATFTGNAQFAQDDRAWAVDLAGARVTDLSTDGDRAWPPGWRVDPDGKGGGLLVRETPTDPHKQASPG
jgi:uncharacterized protein YjbI with pentapeptide repeats